MSLTINAKTYNADSFGADAVTYNGPAHTVSSDDLFKVARVKAKPTSVFSGVGRATAKLTRTATLTGALTPTGKAIVEISVSVPVGMASADVDALLNDTGSFLSSAAAKTLVKNQQINY